MGNVRAVSEKVQRGSFIFYVNDNTDLVITNIDTFKQLVKEISKKV